MELKSYTYTAIEISDYKVYGDTTKTITLTSDNPNQTITFYYEEILGKITIRYVDSKTSQEISTADIYDSLPLLSYTYESKDITYYEKVEPKTQSVILTKADPNQTITFSYKKVVGDIIIKYVNSNTGQSIFDDEVYNNLSFGIYTYIAKEIDNYTLISENSVIVNLSESNDTQTIVFEYEITEEINVDEHPYIATRYVTPTWDINDDVILNFYVTDWNQSDVIDEKMDIYFKVEVRINEVSKIYTKSIGENSINLGKLNEGEYELILQATDKYGRKSHELYNEFRVIDKVKYDNDILNNTHIVTDDELVSYNISKDNSVENSHNTKVGIQNLINNLAASGVKKAILPLGTYRVDSEYTQSTSNSTIQYVKDPISIPSNFILDLNGSTIKQNTTPLKQKIAYVFVMDHAIDSHITNGIIEGDYGDRDLTVYEDNLITAEQVACANIGGESKYCSLNNLTIKKFCGYAVTTGLSVFDAHMHQTGYLTDWVQGDIDENGNINTSISNKFTCGYTALNDFEYERILRSGRYIGFLTTINGNSWIVKYSFYDSSKQFINSIIGHQYRDIKKPDNAKYVKCTYEASDSSVLQNIVMQHYHFPRNCEFKNISFEDTRTCALAPYQGNNMLIDSCTFTRCATTITPCAIDFEDGWHNMQDYCIQNCKILEAVGTSDLVIVGGLDLLFRNNTNWRVSSRDMSRGQVFIDNITPWMNLGLTDHISSAFSICKNNIVTAEDNSPGSGFIGNSLGTLSNIKLIIENCIFNKCQIINNNEKIIYRNCIFNWNEQTMTTRRSIVTGTFYKCTFNDFIYEGFGHIDNFIGYNCKINNMNLEALKGNFKLYNCEINNCSFATYNIDINIDINDSIINDFIFNRITFTKCNIIYKALNSIFNNINVRPNILSDSYSTFDSTKTFKVIANNNIYLNNTVIANDNVLSNKNIDFSENE